MKVLCRTEPSTCTSAWFDVFGVTLLSLCIMRPYACEADDLCGGKPHAIPEVRTTPVTCRSQAGELSHESTGDTNEHNIRAQLLASLLVKDPVSRESVAGVPTAGLSKSLLAETPARAPAAVSTTSCQQLLPAFPGTDGPIKRITVEDMTPFLHQTLQQHHITLLLVLPGPSSDSTKAQQDSSAMKIDWRRLTSVQRVEWVYSYNDFISKWHAHIRHLQHQSSRKPLTAASIRITDSIHKTSAVIAEADKVALPAMPAFPGTPEYDQLPLTKQYPAVALLIQGHNGRLGLQQLNLAAAISRRLRHSHSLSLSYSTHSDKADSLVASTSDAVPLGAAFLSTSVFRNAFNLVYQHKLWGIGGGGSGPGSDFTSTAAIRDHLQRIIKHYNISSMLDSSCGSMHWMPTVLKAVSDTNPAFRFMGTDVVCGLIANHTERFKASSNYQFECLDYASQRLPSGYDLVFSRDSLQHIPMHGAWQLLNNVRASGAKYLLVGSYVNNDAGNRDIAAGGYYPIDLMKPPFSMSRPLEVIDEKTFDGKHMLLFDVNNMTWQDPLWGLM